jgi:hypothetical protein
LELRWQQQTAESERIRREAAGRELERLKLKIAQAKAQQRKKAAPEPEPTGPDRLIELE